MKYIKLLEHYNNDIKKITWEDADKIIALYSDFTVIDKETKKSWIMKRTSGKLHADVEPITAEDSEIMLSCFPKDKSFKEATYRPVIVEIGFNRYGAALMGFPHCGSTSTQFKEKTRVLSGGFRNMRNWDSIRNNDVVGHFCLHFVGSLRHTDYKTDIKAQNAIKSFWD